MQDFAVVPYRFAQGVTEIGPGATPRAPVPIAAPPREARRSLARQSPQGVAGCALREAALDQGLSACRGQAGFIGLVGKQWLLITPSFFLQADDLLVLGAIGRELLMADEMNIEQTVVGGVPLRRWCQCREPGPADVPKALWPQKFDRSEEPGGLLRRNRKAVGAQQRDEGDEDARRARQLSVVVHAAASAIRVSSRGEMKRRSSSSFSARPMERLKASGQRAPP